MFCSDNCLVFRRWEHIHVHQIEASRTVFISLANSFFRRLRLRCSTLGGIVLQLIGADFVWHGRLFQALCSLTHVFFTSVCFSCWDLTPAQGCCLLHNSKPLHDALHCSCSCCWVSSLLPKGLASIYAEVVSSTLISQAACFPTDIKDLGTTKEWLQTELAAATKRLKDPLSASMVSAVCSLFIDHALSHSLSDHLCHVFHFCDHRGSDVRLSDGTFTSSVHSLSPYPAFIWSWKPVQAYAFKQSHHINVLELLVVVIYVESLATDSRFQSLRLFHVLDSRVACAVLAKGRSSSRQLNKLLRRLSALLFACNLQLMPLWTISRWQPCDLGSHVHDYG